MYFLIKDGELSKKYEQIWDVLKNRLGIKFHSKPFHEKKYLKVKVIELDSVIKANFLVNEVPKENIKFFIYAYIFERVIF